MATLAIVFAGVCLLYLAAFGLGWHLSSRGRIGPDRILAPPRRIVDPLTARFQRWHDGEKMRALREKRWGRLWSLIALNNLLAVAIVSRTIYGVTLVLPAYFTWQTGFRQGALLARPVMRMPGPVKGIAGLEFVPYLAATALGVNVPVSMLMGLPLVESVRLAVICYPIVAAAIVAGAWLEVRLIRDKMPSLTVPEGVDMEALRAKAREMMKRQWDAPGNVPPDHGEERR